MIYRISSWMYVTYNSQCYHVGFACRDNLPICNYAAALIGRVTGSLRPSVPYTGSKTKRRIKESKIDVNVPCDRSSRYADF